AERAAGTPALTAAGSSMTYGELGSSMRAFSWGLMALGLGRSQRVAVYLEKRVETVVACFGACAAGGVFVPINPVLKAGQVAHILRDCAVQVLVTSAERLAGLRSALPQCTALRHIVLVNEPRKAGDCAAPEQVAVHGWSELLDAAPGAVHNVVDGDMAAILYTSGSTGLPKGVVLSHRNMVTGAKSVAQYLENEPDDTLLAALPLSFDAGFSQLTTAFHSGARVVL